MDNDFKTFETKQIFNKIYRHKLWGQRPDGAASSGSGSHQAHLVDPYIATIKSLLAQYPVPPTMVDLGCGDFNIGQHFVDEVSKLTACDISDIILAQNARHYSVDHFIFKPLDLTSDPLPEGDIACVRQVLQHLNNDAIASFVRALSDQTPYRQLVVTEHLSSETVFTPNLDKHSGLATRVHLNSGVDLALAPFSLSYQKKEVLLELEEPCEGKKAVLRTTLYTFA